jgi:hypothetical protein
MSNDKLREAAQQPDPDPADIIAGALQTSRAHAYELMHKALAQQDAQCGICGADQPFTGSCGGGRENPRALCFDTRTPSAQQDAQAVPRNPYAAQGSLAEAWQRGYEGRPMLASPGSNYARVYREGKRARNAAPTPPAQQDDIRSAEDELNCAEEVLDGYAAHLDLEETAFDCIGEYITAVCDALKATPTPPAQQDAQAVQEFFSVDGYAAQPSELGSFVDGVWKSNGLVRHLIGQIEALRNAAPTPPAQT